MAKLMVQINPDKFKKEIYRKNHNLSSMSEELGYSNSYLSLCVSEKRVPASVAKYLDSVLGIPQERYEEREEVETKTEVNGNELYDVIYRAVYAAVKQAWKEV